MMTVVDDKKYYYDEMRITIRRRMWSANVYKKSRLSIVLRVICAFVWTNIKFKSVLNFTYLLLRSKFESLRIRSSVSVQDRGKVRFPLEYCKRENGQSQCYQFQCDKLNYSRVSQLSASPLSIIESSQHHPSA